MNKNLQDEKFSAFLDPFTGAYNRSFLFHILPEKIEETKTKKQKFALFMIDLDNFKHVNDTYGHLVGDKVLRDIAMVMRKALREHDFLIRYAGDEFSIILSDIDLPIVYKVADRILEEVRSMKIQTDRGVIQQTLSMGFSLFPADAETQDALIDCADQALYLAKKRGKNSYASFKEVDISNISLEAGMRFFPCAKFVDRKNEAKLAHDKVARCAKGGKLGGIIVVGETGIGKSRFLKETSLSASASGMEVVSFGAYLKNSLAPYFFLVRIFEDYLKQRDDSNGTFSQEIIGSLEKNQREILKFFLPKIGKSSLNDRDIIRDVSAVYETFSCFLAAVIQKTGKPIFLSIDNTQYIDNHSLKFFSYILNNKKNLNILLWLSFVYPLPQGVYDIKLTEKFLEDLKTIPEISIVHLTNISAGDTRDMIAAIFSGLEHNEEFCHLVFEITKGVPFFIEELLKFLLENSCIYFENNEWQFKNQMKDSIPRSLEEIIRTRLKSLDPELREAILISSVIGEDIKPEILSQIRNAKEGDILELLDKAKKLKLVGEESGSFNFLNDTVRNVGLSEIPEARRKTIYHKVSDVLFNYYRDNLESMTSQFIAMFKKTENMEQLRSFTDIVTQKSSEVFQPDLILKYLEEVRKEDSGTTAELEQMASLDETRLPEVVEILAIFQGAMKNFRLYPKGSNLRETILEKFLNTLKKNLERYGLIVISEAEKSLVINDKRIPPRVAKGIDLDAIAKILINRNIKYISFGREVTKEELEKFFEIVSLDPEMLLANGGFNKLLSDQGIVNVTAKKGVYSPISRDTPAGGKVRDKVENMMVLDFILGKVSGKDLQSSQLADALMKNPNLLSQQFLDAVESAQKIDQYSDKIDILSQSLSKLYNLADLVESGKITPEQLGANKEKEASPDVKEITDEQKEKKVPDASFVESEKTNKEPEKKQPKKIVSEEKKEMKVAESSEASAEAKMRNLADSIKQVFMGFDAVSRLNLIRNIVDLKDPAVKILGTMTAEEIVEMFSQAHKQGASLFLISEAMKKIEYVFEGLGRGDELVQIKQKSSGIFGDDQEYLFDMMGDDNLWKSLNLKKKIDAFTKVTSEEFTQLNNEILAGLIVEMIEKNESDEFKRFYGACKKIALTSDKLKEKITAVYTQAFTSIYAPGNEKIRISAVICLLSILSDAHDETDREALTFEFMLLKDITEKLGFYQFKRKEERIDFSEKINFFYLLFELFKEKRASYESLGDVDNVAMINNWVSLFHIEDIAFSLFDFHLKGIINLEIVEENIRIEAYLLMENFLEKIFSVFTKQLTEANDPFNKFVLVRKVKDLFSHLTVSGIEKLLQLIYDVCVQIPDVVDLLAYVNISHLQKFLHERFFTWDERRKTKIIEMIGILKMKDLEGFLQTVSEREYSPALKKYVARIRENLAG